MRVVLLSTYEMGRQPFGLASPAAWLRAGGFDVACWDLALDPLPADALAGAGLIAIHLPMHTATRLAARVLPQFRGRAHLACYGLYAPVNEEYLRALGVDTVIGGEFEAPLLALARGIAAGAVASTPLVSLARQQFLPPDRAGLPPLARYARLAINGSRRVVGYTEASRGCKHLCRHCPIVPVYQGAFRIVQPEAVLEDICRQAERGAQHITFGDPDFFNGPAHAMRIVEALHAAHPALTYDVTIKVEHLLRHARLLPTLRRTGCLFITSAVESIDDGVLRKLDKGHTRADFFEAVRLLREAGLTLAPTFIPFTPWTTLARYRELLQTIVSLDLVENTAPIQLAIRLLVPAGSRLLELPEFARLPFDAAALSYRWTNPDPAVDRLASDLQTLIQREERRGAGRAAIFARIWETAHGRAPDFMLPSRSTIPYLTEPWYC
jgi:radical SAM superfamily enzyme YgiQ (UPF0313 family)